MKPSLLTCRHCGDRREDVAPDGYCASCCSPTRRRARAAIDFDDRADYFDDEQLPVAANDDELEERRAA